ncbi:hypothetical protein ACFPRL_13460 [Pseudoclavibacter helvolus]
MSAWRPQSAPAGSVTLAAWHRSTSPSSQQAATSPSRSVRKSRC